MRRVLLARDRPSAAPARPSALIKIDAEFARDCTASDTDQLLVAAIVQVARGLGKLTVAEAVGDDATIALLAKLGVDYGQGYHLGVPAPLADYVSLARSAA